jgi:hypothetical protein
MKTIESERDEIRLRTEFKRIISESFIHPELLSIKDVPDGFNMVNKAGVDLATDKIYQLMVKESNGWKN